MDGGGAFWGCRARSEAKLLEVVAEVLALQGVPFLVRQRAKERMHGAHALGGGGETVHRVDRALPIRLEVAWRAGEQFRRSLNILGKRQDIEDEVLQGEALEGLAAGRLRGKVAQSHGQGVGEVAKQAGRIQLAPLGPGLRRQGAQSPNQVVAGFLLAQCGHFQSPFLSLHGYLG